MKEDNLFKNKIFWAFIGVVVILLIIAPFIPRDAEEETTKTTSSVASQVTQAPSPTLQPAISQKPTETPYDETKGNNYVAAKYADQFQQVADSAVEGYVEHVYLELSPENVGGKSENDYKKSISSAFLTVQVSNLLWNSTGTDEKKDLVAAWTNSARNTFSGYPHIKIVNGTRTVAEGEWSAWSNEAKITLK